MIAVGQLPMAVSTLSRGKVYLLEHDGLAPVFDVVCSTLRASPSSSIWVTGFGNEAGMKGIPARIYQKKASGPPSRIVEELDYFGVRKGTLVVIEDPFSKDVEEVLATYRRFATERDCAMLLVANLSDSVPDCLGGLARFRQSEGASRWEVVYWFGPSGVVAAASFEIDQREGGKPASDEAPLQDEWPEETVFVTRAALSGKKPPEGWHVVEDLASANTELAHVKKAAIVLHYDRHTDLGELGRIVFGLRQSCGRHARILVRQVNSRLRHSEEQLLLRLGANFVIPAEVLFSHLDDFVGMLRGQVYAKDLDADFDTVIAQIMPSALQGYLLPLHFVFAVREMTARAASLSIRNALVRLKPAPGLTPEDVLRSCWMKRKGDICTADDEQVYLFLFACRESSVEQALDRQFASPVSVLFDGESIFTVAEDILDAVGKLEAETKDGNYSPITLKNPVEPVQIDKGWLAPKQTSPAAVAVRRPLPLRKAGLP